MGKVHGIAGLECHDPVPASGLYFFANLHRGAEGVSELGFEIAEVEHPYGTTEQRAALGSEGGDARVLRITGTIHVVADFENVFFVEPFHAAYIHYGQNRVSFNIWIEQCDILALLILPAIFHQAKDRRGPE